MSSELAAGNVRKMRTRLEQPVQYSLPLGEEEVPLNQYLGRSLQLEYRGRINCIHCDRKTSKSFSQGYCYPCFKRLAQFATVCSPWMLIMFIAGALVLLPRVGHFGGLAGFWNVAQSKIWTGQPPYQSMEVVGPEEGDSDALPAVVLHFAEDEELLAENDGPLRGFAIAGSVKGERSFTAADARIEGHTLIVSSPEVKEPAAVSYGETSGGGSFQIRRKGEEGAAAVPAFRTYVEKAKDVLGFWHIAAFAWICNLAMHLGLSDMALFRYARRPAYGLYSAFGMYLGHYVAWICAGIMGAAVAGALEMNTPLTMLDSGEVAFRALGVVGAVAVVIAGWTTSNPTLYRAGLALQVVTPGWPRWLVTLVAGAITTAIACFPFVFRQLLDFVGLYGLLLMPVGAIVVAEHWIFPRIGFQQFWSSRKGQVLNWPALLSWIIALGAALGCWQGEVLHLFFLAAPVWVLTTVLYIVLAALAGARGPLPEPTEEVAPEPAPPEAAPAEAAPAPARRSRVPLYFGVLAVMCLVSIVLFSYCVFAGLMAPDAIMLQLGTIGIAFRDYLVIATVVYFISGVIWIRYRPKQSSRPAPE